MTKAPTLKKNPNINVKKQKRNKNRLYNDYEPT